MAYLQHSLRDKALYGGCCLIASDRTVPFKNAVQDLQSRRNESASRLGLIARVCGGQECRWQWALAGPRDDITYAKVQVVS